MLSAFVSYDDGSYAVYLPYCSLLQPGRSGEARTPEESAIYATAVSSLPILLSHDAVPVLLFPPDPAAAPPPGAEAAPSESAGGGPAQSESRFYLGGAYGWGCLEMRLATTIKPTAMIFDLSKQAAGAEADATPPIEEMLDACKATRPPPILPEDFAALLTTKAFVHPAETDNATALAALYALWHSLMHHAAPRAHCVIALCTPLRQPYLSPFDPARFLAHTHLLRTYALWLCHSLWTLKSCAAHVDAPLSVDTLCNALHTRWPACTRQVRQVL